MGLTRQELQDIVNTGHVVQLIGDTDDYPNIEFAIYRDPSNGQEYFMSNSERYRHLSKNPNKLKGLPARFKYWAYTDNCVLSVTWIFKNIRKMQDVTLFELV